MVRQSMELPKNLNAPMASKVKKTSKLAQYQTNATMGSHSKDLKPKHNFMANKSNASIEPKILNTSEKNSVCNTGNSRRIEQNRSANFAYNNYIGEMN